MLEIGGGKDELMMCTSELEKGRSTDVAAEDAEVGGWMDEKRVAVEEGVVEEGTLKANGPAVFGLLREEAMGETEDGDREARS